MKNSSKLTDDDLKELDEILDRKDGGKIPNTEALDGFFAALACCPDLVLPSEYMPVIQGGETEDGDLVFEGMDEAQRFMELVNRHWNHVNAQLHEDEVYLPLVHENEKGEYSGNDWANGFICGTHVRFDIWSDLLDDDEHGGPMVAIMALAYENHPDPDMRPFNEPVDDKSAMNSWLLRRRVLCRCMPISSANGEITCHKQAHLFAKREKLGGTNPALAVRVRNIRNAAEMDQRYIEYLMDGFGSCDRRKSVFIASSV